MKKIIKAVITTFVILAGGFLLFYLLLAYPNDQRVKRPSVHFEPTAGQKEIAFNLIDCLEQAVFTSEDFPSSLRALESYPYLNNSRAYHHLRENLHISLGWTPLKAAHKNAIYAPVPTTIEYRLHLPDNPSLEFSYAVLSSIKGVIQAPSRFIIRVIDQEGKIHTLFSEQERPMKQYRWKHRDPLNKQFLQYLNVNLEDRNGRWRYAVVDLQRFAGQEVILQLLTRAPEGNESKGGKRAHAFWGNPIIFNRKSISIPSPNNLIIILVDALRADNLGINGQEGNLTPNIDQLSRGGVNFSHALANGNMTLISVPTILTSRYSFEIPNACRYFAEKINKEEFYRKRIPTIASILKANGYVTRAAGTLMSLADGMGHNVDFGFDDLAILEREGYNTVHLTYDTLQWLERNADKKFFLLLYYNAPHGGDKAPFRYLGRSFRWDLINPRDFLKFTYRAEVAYTDNYVGKVLNALDELRLSDKTMVVLISDHGETMKEFYLPTWKDQQRKSIIYHDHGVSLSDDELNVPMIIRLPGVISPGVNINRTVSLIDLIPTVLEGLGITTSSRLQGRSLFPLIRGEQVGPEPIIYARGLNNKSIRVEDRYKYIRYLLEPEKLPPHVTGREELYDLEKDPRENQNLAAQRPEIVTRLREAMDQVESTQYQTLISFSNLAGKIVEGEIRVDGEIEKFSLEKERDVIEVEGSTVSFRINSGNNTLKLQTKPDDAPLRFQISINGNSIPLNEILVSEYGLPLLTNSEGSIKKEDLKYIRGIYRPDPDDKEPAIYLGRLPRRSSWKLIPEKKLLPQDLKVMLEDWGYIQKGRN